MNGRILRGCAIDRLDVPRSEESVFGNLAINAECEVLTIDFDLEFRH